MKYMIPLKSTAPILPVLHIACVPAAPPHVPGWTDTAPPIRQSALTKLQSSPQDSAAGHATKSFEEAKQAASDAVDDVSAKAHGAAGAAQEQAR